MVAVYDIFFYHMTFSECQSEENMKQMISGYPVLEGEVKKALKELEQQNYGNAKKILEAALKNTKETYIINSGGPYFTDR